MCSYLKCIVYDKLLKHRQSYSITVYYGWIHLFHDIVYWQTTSKMMLSVRVRKIWGKSSELSDCQILKPMDAAEAARFGQKVRVLYTRMYLRQDDLRGHRPYNELYTYDRWKESVVITCGVDVCYIP